MSGMYPEIQPYACHSVDVSDRHRLYVEESGNSQGIPLVFLHGGPGAGCEPFQRRFFDPRRYRIVLFDQRGCGKSKPHADLTDNTTQHLVADIERIREHLGIERWLVFGGSWGSTLGLVYAETYPERVLGLVLRGIFLCRSRDIRWFYQEGASYLFPDYWQDYLAPIQETERGNMVAAYYARLTGDNEVTRMAAAKAWSLWEGRTATLLPRQSVIHHFADPFTALSLARIECHYFMNNSFLETDQILNRADRLQGIPGIIVHGRYDVICPIEQAFALHQVWPEAKLEVIADAGHSATEIGIVKALVRATDDFAKQLS